MYIPAHYQNHNEDEILAFIKANPFGILVTQEENGPVASHLPFMLQGDKQNGFTLVSHLSKANNQWKSFEKQQEVLVIFNGPQHYISSSWYKEEEVPTWDYIAVHAYGKVSIMKEEQLIHALHQLVHEHEQHEAQPVALSKMSPHTQNQYKGVVGFSLAINKLEAAYKLSQTRNEDHSRIIKELEAKEQPQAKEIAAAIKALNATDKKLK